jgi:TRAP-type mannitol/chloroaromatic compound transport system permease small subunit
MERLAARSAVLDNRPSRTLHDVDPNEDRDLTATPRAVTAIDTLSEWIGRAVSWLSLLMVLTVVATVIARYFLGVGAAWTSEAVTWMHAAVFMLAAASTLRHDEHVRVDVFYRGATPRRRAWVDISGTILFLLPVCGFVLYESIPYVHSSWMMREASREADGLPALYVLKAVIPVTAALLALQGVAEILRAIAVLRGGAETR